MLFFIFFVAQSFCLFLGFFYDSVLSYLPTISSGQCYSSLKGHVVAS